MRLELFKKQALVAVALVFPFFYSHAQQAVIREEVKSIKTYPFSDPDPVPILAGRGRIYPYFKFEGYSHAPKMQSWKVVTLENDYLKVTVFPEIGGKVWGAFEKSTGEDFIYNNGVVKFRNIAMRGPWTSGGIEFNFGIIGHTPVTASPVDYLLMENEDGSVTCVVGTMDLPSRTQWRVKINLPKDKAYFETDALWYNSAPIHNSYYNWMTAAARASDDLEFFYPGYLALEHSGEPLSWPYNNEGRKVSLYRENNFGSSKSYHVVGSFNNFFGGYFHDKNLGFGTWAPYDEMPGKKLWIWALSRSGGIWEDLLTDNSGQYIEFQAGRLFNQFSPSPLQPTPLKKVGFSPYSADNWKNIWFPVRNTGGISSASPLGSIYVKRNSHAIEIKFNALQIISDRMRVLVGDKEIYATQLSLKPMDLFTHSLNIPTEEENLEIFIGERKIFMDGKEDPYKLDKPFAKTKAFPYSEAQKLFDEGNQNFLIRNYSLAREKLEACLKLDPAHQQARIRYAELLYRNALYEEALSNVKLALENDLYDCHANYIAGIIYKAMNKPLDALEALGWAARSMEYRSAAYALMSEVHLQEKNIEECIRYASQALDYNRYNLNAYKALAVGYRLDNNTRAALEAIEKIIEIDPLNHFGRYEKYVILKNQDDLQRFISIIQNEFPYQSYLELAMDYLKLNRHEEAISVLSMSPEHALIDLWLAYLARTNSAASEKHLADALRKSAEFVFPFREETLDVLEWASQKTSDWKIKYYYALNLWAKEQTEKAIALFKELENKPDYAPFYLTRAALLHRQDGYDQRKDFEKALSLDNNQWRTWHILNQYLEEKRLYDEQLAMTSRASKKFKDNYVIGMDHANALLNNKKYDQALALLEDIVVLPYEGASDGRKIFEQVCLYSALESMKKGNFSRAKSRILKSLEWPENLGAGKPYEFDERKQDYLLAYISEMTKQGNSDSYLRKINEYTMNNVERQSWNQTLGLLAMKKLGDQEALTKLLNELKASNRPASNFVLAWWEGNESQIRQTQNEMADNRDFALLMDIIGITKGFSSFEAGM